MDYIYKILQKMGHGDFSYGNTMPDGVTCNRCGQKFTIKNGSLQILISRRNQGVWVLAEFWNKYPTDMICSDFIIKDIIE